MARMYSGKKGKSGSKKPLTKSLPTWLGYKPKEIELLVAKFAKEGKTPSQIGTMLRDIYGIPDVRKICGKNLGKILVERKITTELPEDIMALMKKSVNLAKHTELNKQDMSAKRGLQLTQSKIGRLVKYYKRTKRLPEDWKYDPKKAAMFIE